jgi:hypothetical protein
MAADVPGAAGNEDWDFAHARGLAKRGGDCQRARLTSALGHFLTLAGPRLNGGNEKREQAGWDRYQRELNQPDIH